jgi:hypothetical protein
MFTSFSVGQRTATDCPCLVYIAPLRGIRQLPLKLLSPDSMSGSRSVCRQPGTYHRRFWFDSSSFDPRVHRIIDLSIPIRPTSGPRRSQPTDFLVPRPLSPSVAVFADNFPTLAHNRSVSHGIPDSRYEERYTQAISPLLSNMEVRHMGGGGWGYGPGTYLKFWTGNPPGIATWGVWACILARPEIPGLLPAVRSGDPNHI